MIYISCGGENAKEVKYEVKKVQYIKCGSGLNKITISPKTKDGKYETVMLNIWGDELGGITAHDWDNNKKGDEIIIRQVKSIEIQEYNGKQFLSLTIPSNGFSIVGANVDADDTPINKVASDDFLPF